MVIIQFITVYITLQGLKESIAQSPVHLKLLMSNGKNSDIFALSCNRASKTITFSSVILFRTN